MGQTKIGLGCTPPVKPRKTYLLTALQYFKAIKQGCQQFVGMLRPAPTVNLAETSPPSKPMDVPANMPSALGVHDDEDDPRGASFGVRAC